MLNVGILYASIICALIAPLVAAIIVGVSSFFHRDFAVIEKTTYRLVRFFSVFTLASSTLAIVAWWFSGIHYGSIPVAKFYIGDLEISFRLFFDWINLAFLFTCSLICAIIVFFSHRYLHRDPGYRRFFFIISLFAFGMNLIIMAGTFDLIFAGWEIVGLSSFLLIGYFWHRPKAIGAATRAYYIYRVCDLGLLASILISHFFWHDVSIFADFSKTDLDSILSHVPMSWRWLLSVCILLSVLGKSAQFPFCYWLPKAMEGPTHSSAIFYGSLSIHAGVFLLIRTSPLWHSTPGFNYLLAAIGIITAFSATACAHVQSTIKGQIGYASVAQVGLMLLELSCGLKTIAFFHMVGNAFLRCFQLLVSSSILTTHLHMQGVVRTFGDLSRFSLPQLFPKALRPSLYVFAINDGFFESILKKTFVNPTMNLAIICNDLIHAKLPAAVNQGIIAKKKQLPPGATVKSFSPLLFALFLGAILDVIFRSHDIIRLFSLIAALILALGALGERRKAVRALTLAIFGNLFAFLSITSSTPGFLYLIGLITSSLIAVESLRHIERKRTIPDLKEHLGLYQQFPMAGTMLLIGCLGVVSFPFSSTFYGQDLLLRLSIESGLHYLLIFQFIFIVSGIAIIKFYSKVMLGRRDNVMKDLHLDFNALNMATRIVLFIIGNIAAFWLALS